MKQAHIYHVRADIEGHPNCIHGIVRTDARVCDMEDYAGVRQAMAEQFTAGGIEATADDVIIASLSYLGMDFVNDK